MKLPDWKLLEVTEDEIRTRSVFMSHVEYVKWSIQRLKYVIKRGVSSRSKRRKLYTSRGLTLYTYRKKAVEFFEEKLKGYGFEESGSNRPNDYVPCDR